MSLIVLRGPSRAIGPESCLVKARGFTYLKSWPMRLIAAHKSTLKWLATARRAMRLALQDAGCEAKDVDYVNLHGTSTLLNDRIETSALKLAFDGQAARIPMSATKSQIGHPQGASGAAG